MKILYHHRTRSKDGQAVHIEEMIAAWRSLGHEIVLVNPAGSDDTSFGEDSNALAWLKRAIPRFAYELLELGYNLIAYRQLLAAVRKHRPDCLYERYNLFLLAGTWLKRKTGLPMLLEINSPIYEERAEYGGIALHRLARWAQRTAWRAADVVLPVSGVLAQTVAAYGVPAERIVVMHNGINTERFGHAPDTEAAKLALALEGKLVLGFTGFIREWHGLDKIISMMADDPPNLRRHLLVVGNGPAREALQEQARELGICGRVTFTGVIGRDDVARYVAAFDIALQPAVVAYASPLKLFEYLALGKAIIAPAQPNIAEILTDGSNALLFDPADPQGLPKALERLTQDPSLRARIAQRARETISERRLTWRANAEHCVTLFGKLMRGNAGHA